MVNNMTDGMKPAWGNGDYQQLALYLQTAGADSKAHAISRADMFAWMVRETSMFNDKKDRDRSMRDCVAQGVRNGEFPVICSGPSGYYVTQDSKQIEAAVDFLDSRIESLSIRKAGLKRASREAKRREAEQARGNPDSGHRFQGNMFSTGPGK